MSWNPMGFTFLVVSKLAVGRLSAKLRGHRFSRWVILGSQICGNSGVKIFASDNLIMPVLWTSWSDARRTTDIALFKTQ